MLPSKDDLTDAQAKAAEWLLRHDIGLGQAEADAFNAWLARSRDNAVAWSDAQAMWASFDDEPDPLLLSIQHSARSLRRSVWRVSALQGTAMAASVLLCLGVLGWGSGLIPDQDRTPAPAIASVGDSYDAGAKRTEVVLKDGSRVMLDAHSAITVKISGVRRDVAMVEGEAFFRVAHDARRPFVVSANGTTVTATGTAFSVSVEYDRTTAILEEGTVTVAYDGTVAAKLRPGQKYLAAKGGSGTVSDVDVAAALAWRTGYVELHNVTIGEAVSRMNRYTSKPVIVGDAAAGALRVTGQFRTEDPIRFVNTLSELYPVRIRRSAGGDLEIVSDTRSRGR